jgi:hypothetical protein
VEHRLVGVGCVWLVLVQLLFFGRGWERVGWVRPALGTLLGPEGSGFGLAFSDWALLSPCGVGGLLVRTDSRSYRSSPPLVGVGLAPVWGRSPPVA